MKRSEIRKPTKWQRNRLENLLQAAEDLNGSMNHYKNVIPEYSNLLETINQVALGKCHWTYLAFSVANFTNIVCLRLKAKEKNKTFTAMKANLKVRLDDLARWTLKAQYAYTFERRKGKE